MLPLQGSLGEHAHCPAHLPDQEGHCYGGTPSARSSASNMPEVGCGGVPPVLGLVLVLLYSAGRGARAR